MRYYSVMKLSIIGLLVIAVIALAGAAWFFFPSIRASVPLGQGKAAAPSAEVSATIDPSSLETTEGNKVISGTAIGVDAVLVNASLKMGPNSTFGVNAGHDTPVIDGRWSVTLPEESFSCNRYHVDVFVPVPGAPSGQVKSIASGDFQGTCTYILHKGQ